MEKLATLSTSIDSDLKKALAAFCKKRGLKIQSVVENAIREQLEDEIDLASYDERKKEDEISLANAFLRSESILVERVASFSIDLVSTENLGKTRRKQVSIYYTITK